MQHYWLCLDNGALEGPYDPPTLAHLRQIGRLKPRQRLQRVSGGDLLPASAVLPNPAAEPLAQIAPPPLQHALSLRPLGTAALLDRIFEFYRQHFLQFFLFGCMSYGLLSFANILLGQMPQSGEIGDMLRAAWEHLPLLAVSGVLWLAGVIVLLLMQGALTFLVAETYLGRPQSIRQTLRVIPSRGLPVLLTILLKTALLAIVFSLVLIPPALVGVYAPQLQGWHWGLVGVGLLVALVPGLVLLVRWFITLPVVMLEATSGWNAMRRSSQLIGHRSGGGFWQWGETRLSIILLVLLVVGLLLTLAGYLPRIFTDVFTQRSVQELADVTLLGSVLHFLANSLMMPLYTVATTLFYLDLRMRREGLDLEILAKHVPPPNAPRPS